jgi:hypothetical protein
MKYNCFCCEREIDAVSWAEDVSPPHPYDALHFRTHGHYGSAVFDPVTAYKCIDVVICDLCIMEKLDIASGSGVQELIDNRELYTKAAQENADLQEAKQGDET